MLSWLQLEGMIAVEPLISGTSPNWGRPSVLTRAYVGLLITIINYDTYQDGKLYKGKDWGRPSSRLGQLRKECINNDKDPAEISSQISVLKQRYPDREIIDQTLEAISSTRKTGRIADSVQLSILKGWDRYPVDRVMAGVTTYLEKDYAGQEGMALPSWHYTKQRRQAPEGRTISTEAGWRLWLRSQGKP